LVNINENNKLNYIIETSEVSEVHKRERIDLYFNPPIKDFQQYLIFGIISLVAGLVLFIFGITDLRFLLFLAFALFAIGGFLLYLFFTRKKIYDSKLVPDAELDLLLEDDILKIKEYMLERLNTDPVQLMIDTVYSSYYLATAKKDDIQDIVKFGADGLPRFTPIMIHAVNFTTEELMLYNIHFDFIKGDIIKEETISFYYKDIVTFSTDAIIDTVFLNKNITNESFTLYTSAGTSVNVVLKNWTEVKAFKEYIPTSDPENVIVALRKILREKKI